MGDRMADINQDNDLNMAECLVVYFDIFGFSKIVEESKNIAALTKTLLQLWDWIRAFRNKRNVIPFLFSDGGFLLYPLPDQANRGTFLTNVVQDISLLQDTYFDKGYFLRGAVTIGRVAFSHSLVVGQAIVRAYSYESNLCPGPFIMFPVGEIDKLSRSKGLIQDVEMCMLPLKSQKGVMQCHIIFPSDKAAYIQEIADRAARYTKKGPFEWGKLWYESLLFLSETFKEFKNWRIRNGDD
jgi:hypothetical protein